MKAWEKSSKKKSNKQKKPGHRLNLEVRETGQPQQEKKEGGGTDD